MLFNFAKTEASGDVSVNTINMQGSLFSARMVPILCIETREGR